MKEKQYLSFAPDNDNFWGEYRWEAFTGSNYIRVEESNENHDIIMVLGYVSSDPDPWCECNEMRALGFTFPTTPIVMRVEVSRLLHILTSKLNHLADEMHANANSLCSGLHNARSCGDLELVKVDYVTETVQQFMAVQKLIRAIKKKELTKE